VRLDGERVSDRELRLAAGATHVLQVGKRAFAEITLVAKA
jgi:tyrosyl-tRNA synthetase